MTKKKVKKSRLTDEQREMNMGFLSRLATDLNLFMEMVQNEDIAITGYAFVSSYTTAEGEDTGALGMSGKVNKVLDVLDVGISDLMKEQEQTAKDKKITKGVIH